MQVVHITLLTRRSEEPRESVWGATVCQVNIHEEEMWNEWTETAFKADWGKNLGYQYAIAHQKHCHYNSPRSRFDIRALRLCRRFYEEVHEVLYRNTIFAFSRGSLFGRWFEARTDWQLKHVRGLQFHTTETSDQRGCAWLAEETKVERLRKLSSLQWLDLYLTLSPIISSERFVSRFWERFQICPFKEVYIIPNNIELGPKQVAAMRKLRSTLLRKWNDDQEILDEIEQEVETVWEHF